MTGEAPHQRTNLLVALIGVLIIAVDGFDLQNIGYLAPEIAREWDVPLASFGLVFGAGLGGTIPGAMLAGPAARVLGLRATLGFSLLTFSAGTFASSVAPSIEMLAVIRFATGIGLGAAIPLVMTMVAGHASVRHRSTLVVAALCGQPIGAALGAPVAAELVELAGWRSALWLGAAAPLVLLPALALLPATARSAHEGPAGKVRDLFAPGLAGVTLRLWAASFALIFSVYVILNWLPGIVRLEGYSLRQSALAVSLCNAGTIVGAILLGLAMDRFGAKRVVPIALFVAAASLLALDVFRGELAVMLAMALSVGIFGGGSSAAFGALIIAAYPAGMRATGSGWALGIGRIGGALSPVAAGAILSTGAAGARLLDLAALSTVAAALFVMSITLPQLQSAAAPKGRQP